MGDMGDIFNEMKQERRELRKRLGVNCPGCKVKEPKRTPTILLKPWRRDKYGASEIQPALVVGWRQRQNDEADRLEPAKRRVNEGA